jgi:thiol-disulfide isomerase/thioredoxin
MKTKWLFIPMLALALGCTQETKNDVTRIEGEFTLYAHSGDNKTKTILQQDGSVFWSPGDCINVFYGNLSGRFASDNTEPADFAGFSGMLGVFSLDGETEFMAAYPYSRETSLSGGTFHIDLPAGQEAVEGTFADDLFICVAKSKDFDLYFYNVCGGVKFSVAKEGIKKVVFRGNGGESLAGRLAVGFSDGKPRVEGIDDGKTAVTLTAPDGGTFQQGAFYYLVLAPQSLPGGYTMEFYSDVLEGTVSDDTPVTIRRSVWGTLRDLTPQSSHPEVVPDAAVDFGLPSGTKWAPYNVGATSPEEVGQYYAWGEILPKDRYDWGGYLHADGDEETCHDIGREISGTEYDVATQRWGKHWAMPTIEQVKELVTNSTSRWTTEGGVSGVRLTSRINGNSLFFPVTGVRMETGTYDTERCYLWTGSQKAPNLSEAYRFILLYSEETSCAASGYGGFERCSGQPVRPVYVEPGIATPDMVDLGLSVKWASFNLGASQPEEYGNYYAWGETEPKENYWWTTYKWGDSVGLTKYDADGATDLSDYDYEDDAAFVKLGSKWRIPTVEEFDELVSKCTWVWEKRNGVSGYRVTGPNGNAIFFPAAGYYSYSDGNPTAGWVGEYWASSVDGEYTETGYYLHFYEVLYQMGRTQRCYGQSIRPVYGERPAPPEVFEITPSEITMGSEGGEFSVDVTTNIGYKITSTPAWITELTDGEDTRTHRFRVAPNESDESRSGVIVFCNDREVCVPVTVKQGGNDTQAFDWNRQFYHRSLILEFSATWCGYCSITDHSLSATHEKYPDRFVSVNVQGNGSNLEFSEHGPLSDLFDVSGYPSSYMDFRRKIGNYEADYYSNLFNRYLEEQEENYPAVTTAALNSSLSGSNLNVDVTLFVKEEGDYKVAVYLTESGIVGYQADHTDGDRYDYRHDDVVRLSLTDVLGDAFSVTAANTRLKRSYSVAIPSGYDRNQLKLLVYIQRAYGSKPRLQDGSFGDYYVDNCLYAEVGRSVPPAVVAGSGGGNEDVSDGKPVNW